MRIDIIGGGPGGLYAALLLKAQDPDRTIQVFDRNPPDATYGWGVVFSDETLGFLEEADRPSYQRIVAEFVHWEAIDIWYRDQCIRSGGHAFSGLGRAALLRILQDRCREVGVSLTFERDITDLAGSAAADLVIAADGFNSRIRSERSDVFQPSFDVHGARYIWLGTTLPLDAFTFYFRPTEFGMFQVHAYPFAANRSTFIVECTEETWRRAGLNEASEAESVAFCSSLFADVLHGEPLLSNRSTWLNFVTLRNENWYDGTIVLLGDAAHTAHFSIGSGTKIAMEDAIALAGAIAGERNIPAALVEYEELRQPVVERTQAAARDSSLWFEHVARYAGFDPEQFAFSLLTRSKRITYDNLRLRDPALGHEIDAHFSSSAGVFGGIPPFPPPAPVDVPFRLGGLVVPNRVVVRAVTGDGTRAEERLAGYAAALIRAPGLLLTGPVAVSEDGRSTTEDGRLYTAEQCEEWRGRVELVHRSRGTAIGVTLRHAGPRAGTRPPSDGVDRPLAQWEWPLLAASPIRYARGGRTPEAIQAGDMDRVLSAFVASAQHAALLDFDLLELDCSHGYLLASFLSPLTNHRDDEFGGSTENRLRYPLQVVEAVRHVWPPSRPLLVSFSVSDWQAGGISLEEAVVAAQQFRDAGCDGVHVVSGQTTARANPPYGRGWETPLADLIRNEARVPVLVGGYLCTRDEANTLLAAGRADLCLLTPALTHH